MTGKLACYAVSQGRSRQRGFEEKPHPYRTAFERDRDRIMHCSAFRRLEGKTQVFMPGVNDHYRTRLTHSIEVAQIGRTIARVLNLNESLTEAICLGHDLGHSPFGHAGEKTLDDLMASFGGFEHNRQALRIVDLLEHPYPDFAGLNLMYETRLGIARHHGPYDESGVDEFDEANCSLEGQIADIADRIAYNCHDLEDGLRAGLINEDQLKDVKLFADAQAKIGAQAITDCAVRNVRTAKSIIDMLVSDCLEASATAIAQANVKSPPDVYEAADKLIKLSAAARTDLGRLEEFLFENMYMHKLLQTINKDVAKWLKSVFEKFCSEPDLMPPYYRQLVSAEGLERTVCDYIAGMTDWYCLSMLKEI
ncbi:MAG: deoxyguanosinetriphosphate triphosphohydrolase [Deltaproteobacteria bacterium]|nr:MAG: deoxyguanosinetriphosphate triphosphohydrolase [Deltaproteobacteria bacterium]